MVLALRSTLQREYERMRKKEKGIKKSGKGLEDFQIWVSLDRSRFHVSSYIDSHL